MSRVLVAVSGHTDDRTARSWPGAPLWLCRSLRRCEVPAVGFVCEAAPAAPPAGTEGPWAGQSWLLGESLLPVRELIWTGFISNIPSEPCFPILTCHTPLCTKFHQAEGYKARLEFVEFSRADGLFVYISHLSALEQDQKNPNTTTYSFSQ